MGFLQFDPNYSNNPIFTIPFRTSSTDKKKINQDVVPNIHPVTELLLTIVILLLSWSSHALQVQTIASPPQLWHCQASQV